MSGTGFLRRFKGLTEDDGKENDEESRPPTSVSPDEMKTSDRQRRSLSKLGTGQEEMWTPTVGQRHVTATVMKEALPRGSGTGQICIQTPNSSCLTMPLEKQSSRSDLK